jgi:MerR family transcriptional regulator, light-induced transcriptional regulator
MHQKTILSTADVARLFNVTETTVKRWANDGLLKCMKTPGGHRKFEMRNVVEFASVLKFEPSGALKMTEEDELAQKIQVAILARDFMTLRDAFLEKALSTDKRDLFIFFSFLYQHRIHLWEIFDLIVGPGMAIIGEQWAQGLLTVEQEHRASYETMDAIAKLQTQIHVKPENGNCVVCACPGEEQHEIGLRCASYLFESEGWLSHYLGARTPYDSVVSAVKELDPALLCLSITVVPQHEQEIQDLRAMINTLKLLGTKMIIGGYAIQRQPELIGHIGATYSSSLELLAYIKKFEDQPQAH